MPSLRDINARRIRRIKARCVELTSRETYESKVLDETFDKIVRLSQDRPVTASDKLVFMTQSVVEMDGWEDFIKLRILGKRENTSDNSNP